MAIFGKKSYKTSQNSLSDFPINDSDSSNDSHLGGEVDSAGAKVLFFEKTTSFQLLIGNFKECRVIRSEFRSETEYSPDILKN